MPSRRKCLLKIIIRENLWAETKNVRGVILNYSVERLFPRRWYVVIVAHECICVCVCVFICSALVGSHLQGTCTGVGDGERPNCHIVSGHEGHMQRRHGYCRVSQMAAVPPYPSAPTTASSILSQPPHTTTQCSRVSPPSNRFASRFGFGAELKRKSRKPRCRRRRCNSILVLSE